MTARRSWRAWYMIAILALISVFGYIDRQILNLLVEPIKADFAISDTQLSLLLGTAFMAAYVGASPIIGRLVDTSSRRNLLIAQISIWSLFTVSCGLARSYGQLFFTRMGVGAAESGLTPASWSMITDQFDAKRLPLAFSIYLMAPFVGMGLAMILGGVLLESAPHWNVSGIPLLAHMKPWQLVFAAVGLPGLLLALALLTVKEPPRTHPTTASDATPRLAEVFGMLWRHRGFYANFYLGMAGIIAVNYSVPAWLPSFLIRKFGATAGQVGIDYGVMVLVAGVAGVLAGPWLGKLLARMGYDDALVRVPVISAIGLTGCGFGLYIASSYSFAIGCASLAAFFYSLPQAMSASAIQLVTPNRMRGLTTSLYIFTINIVGLGIGPTAVALISDRVFHDPTRIGEALAIVCILAATCAALLTWRAVDGYRQMRIHR